MHEGFGTMMARAHGNAQTVEQRAHVKVVNLTYLEGDDTVQRTSLAQAPDVHPFDLRETLHGILREGLFVGAYGFKAQLLHIIYGARQSRRGDVVGRAGFELVGQIVVGGVLERDVAYHLAAAHVGGQLLEPGAFAVEHADAGGAVHLVAREGEEVAVERLDIDAPVRGALSAVHEHRNAVSMCRLDDFLDGCLHTQHVAHMRHGHQAGVLREEPFEGCEIQFSVVAHGDDAQTESRQLPGDDVGVVLQGRDDDFASGVVAVEARHRCGDQVDALRRAARENDFFRRSGAEEAAHRFAGGFVQIGGALREEVHAAMHVGVHVVVFLRHGLDHRTRLLCRGGVVEIDKRVFVINLA